MNVFRLNEGQFFFMFRKSEEDERMVRRLSSGDVVVLLHGPLRARRLDADGWSIAPFEDWYVLLAADGELGLVQFCPLTASGPLFVPV